ncbi:MAG: VWA domain-containing protein [Acidilobaceae archaeon]|nr:VWA domain-containing protein [Acidilobaceae archaeon]MCX8165389.1 VWA domain-containing protein [Acidilobaceae archaeon]MDW7973816.1 VWA domain-containing protein [Sulfolobales archaeon]
MGEKESIIEGVGHIDEVKEYRGKKILELARRLSDQPLPESFTPELAVDIFYAFKFPLPFVKDRGDNFRRTLLIKLLASQNIWKVKPYTVADSVTSVVAAASLLEKLARLMSVQTPQSSRSSGRQERGRENVSEEQIASALEQVATEVKAAKDMKRLLTGLGAGVGSSLSFEDTLEEMVKLARDTDISKVLEKLEGIKLPSPKGKYERSNMGWIEGIELGSDLERVYPSQLALPSYYFLSLFADSQLVLYRKVTSHSKGPIYVLMDKSGSMVGNKIDWARAVALALLKRTSAEGRGFYARFFDSVAYPPVSLAPNSKPSEFVKVLSYLARVKAGGGTDIAKAIVAACDDIVKERGKVSDIILISDGEDRVMPDLLSKALKKANARLHTIMIQGQNNYLRQVSVRYMTARKLEASELLKVVDFD